MSQPIELKFEGIDIPDVKSISGALVIFATPDGKLDTLGRKVNSASGSQILRLGY